MRSMVPDNQESVISHRRWNRTAFQSRVRSFLGFIRDDDFPRTSVRESVLAVFFQEAILGGEARLFFAFTAMALVAPSLVHEP